MRRFMESDAQGPVRIYPTRDYCSVSPFRRWSAGWVLVEPRPEESSMGAFLGPS